MAISVHIEDGDELDLMERRLTALRLHTAGVPYKKIGEQLGVSAQTVMNDVRAQLKAELRESADDLIARQKAVLRDIMRAHYGRMLAGDVASTKAITDAMAHQCKLFGLYAPAKVSVVSDEDFTVTLARIMLEVGLTPPGELAHSVPHYPTVRELEPADITDDTDDDWAT